MSSLSSVYYLLCSTVSGSGVPAQFAAGWLLGWLRHKTDTFVPGAVLHVIINITVGLLTA